MSWERNSGHVNPTALTASLRATGNLNLLPTIYVRGEFNTLNVNKMKKKKKLNWPTIWAQMRWLMSCLSGFTLLAF